MFRFTLTNAGRMVVEVITYGPIIRPVGVPDRSGSFAGVAL